MGDGLHTFEECTGFATGVVSVSCGARYCGPKDIHRFPGPRKYHKIAEDTAGVAETCKPLRRKPLHTIRYRKWEFTLMRGVFYEKEELAETDLREVGR